MKKVLLSAAFVVVLFCVNTVANANGLEKKVTKTEAVAQKKAKSGKETATQKCTKANCPKGKCANSAACPKGKAAKGSPCKKSSACTKKSAGSKTHAKVAK
jgi:hypothetical protein